MDCPSLILFITLILLYPNSIDSAHNKPALGPAITVRKHISFPDFSSTTIIQDINLLGSAIISTGKASVQIPDATKEADDIRHLAGRAIYASPIRLFDPRTRTPASFQTIFSFQFQKAASSSSSSPSNNKTTLDGGSGLSFIMVPDEFTVGRPGPWLGTLNDACEEDYKSVAIEFDTRQNPEFGDPNDNHIGINLGSMVSTQVINASDAGVYLKDGSIHRAWISYDGQRRYIDIRLVGDDKDYYPSKPVYSGPLDLSTFLNEYMFVGFSASTGDHTQIHNILSWNFTATSQASLRVPPTDACESKIMLESGQSSAQGAHNKTPTSFLIFVAVVILLFAVLLNFHFNRRRKDEGSTETTAVLPQKKQRPTPPNKPRRFTVAEIFNATRGFSELLILGNDARSVTYKGSMLNGCNVAVKRVSPQFFTYQGLDKRRMHKQIKAVSKIRHPNMVPIRGWCFNHQETIVVYDYIPNGSLDKWLFGVGVLPWTRRFKVIKDVADALSYLHSKQLAHKNVKTSSVFLDVSLRAVLGDFGFVLPSAESTRFESVVSQTADAFEFGLFVLEVVAGRGRKSNPGEPDLLDLAWVMQERDEKIKLVDGKMGTMVNMEQAIRVIEIGLLCTLNENKGRPSVEDVVEFLNLEKPIPELPPNRPVSLFPYSSTTGLCTGYKCATFK